jgi:hypothetical protein
LVGRGAAQLFETRVVVVFCGRMNFIASLAETIRRCVGNDNQKKTVCFWWQPFADD